MNVDMHRAKGKYAKYKIKKLTPRHLIILEVLNEANEPMTTRAIKESVNMKQKARGEKGEIEQPQITGRLSEMGRIKLVEMTYGEVSVADEDVPTFRFERKPVWAILEKGKRALELRSIP